MQTFTSIMSCQKEIRVGKSSVALAIKCYVGGLSPDTKQNWFKKKKDRSERGRRVGGKMDKQFRYRTFADKIDNPQSPVVVLFGST